MIDSRITSIEIKERKPKGNPLYPPNNFPVRSVTIRWTFGALSGIVDLEHQLMLPLPRKQNPLSFVSQEDYRQKVEQMVRDWLSLVYRLECMKDCGDIGACKFHCSRVAVGPPVTERGIIDRYRPVGTLREATDEELHDAAWCAWMDGYLCGERLENTIPTTLADMNLKATNDRIVNAFQKLRLELARNQRPWALTSTLPRRTKLTVSL